MKATKVRRGKKFISRSDIKCKSVKARVTGTRKNVIRVVPYSEQKQFITGNDAEMDTRAREAVRSAVAKSIFCKKPVARYDVVTRRTYLEYADGKRKYVD